MPDTLKTTGCLSLASTGTLSAFRISWRSGVPALGEWSSFDTVGFGLEVDDPPPTGPVGDAGSATEADALTEGAVWDDTDVLAAVGEFEPVLVVAGAAGLHAGSASNAPDKMINVIDRFTHPTPSCEGADSMIGTETSIAPDASLFLSALGTPPGASWATPYFTVTPLTPLADGR
jgi:hypothetical protein